MFRKLLHKTLYAIIVFFSFLPLGVLYFFSTVSYILLYHVFKYRHEVVKQNIDLAFPELTLMQRKLIVKKFYIDFCDHFFETIKLLSISEKQLHSMFTADYSAIEELNYNGKSCYILLGHQFNWELVNAHMTSINKTRTIVAYLPVINKFFDGLLIKIRTRFGSILTPSDKLLRGLYPYRNELIISPLWLIKIPRYHQMLIGCLSSVTMFLFIKVLKKAPVPGITR